MKKKIAIILLVTGTSLMAIGQNPLQTDWQTEDLKGKIKNMKSVTYRAVDKFGQIHKGEMITQITNKYNNKGHLTEQIKIEDGESNTKTYTYKYDNNGKRIEESDYNSDKELLAKHIYRYNHAGKLTECFVYDGLDSSLVGKFLYQYSDNGNCEERLYSAYGTLSKKAIYDNKYNLLEEYTYDDNGYLEAKNVYEYKDGHLISAFAYDYFDELIRQMSCNDKGDGIEFLFYEDGKTEKYTSTYKYDTKGNWIEYTTTKSEADIVLTIETREFEYYE
jgi:YD repeat-containing protein